MHARRFLAIAALLSFGLVLLGWSARYTEAQSAAAVCDANATMRRVSVGSGGSQSNNASSWPEISGDGKFAIFSSSATNLVSSDSNGRDDVFIYDWSACTTTRVSVGSSNSQLTRGSIAMDVSDTGRFVLYNTRDSAVVSGDSNNVPDLFLYDRQNGSVVRVSVAAGGTQANAPSYLGGMSSDGRYVVFTSDANNIGTGDTTFDTDVFVKDTKTGAVTVASVGSGGRAVINRSSTPAISGDGNYAAFTDLFDGLISEKNSFDHDVDVYVDNVRTRDTIRASVDNGGNEVTGNSTGAALSGDGRYVVFSSLANNLVSSDSNGVSDVFVRDRQNNSTTRVSVTSSGGQANGASGGAAISADGRYVAFSSDATNLVSGDRNGQADIFVRDLQDGETIRVSLPAKGGEGNGPSTDVSISADGQELAFLSTANNLVDGDTNGVADVFIVRLSVADTPSGSPTNTPTPTLTPTLAPTVTPTLTPTLIPTVGPSPTPLPPQPPTPLSPGNGANLPPASPPTFRWSAVSGAVRYEFQLRGGTISQINATVTTPSYTLANNLPVGSYEWRVRGVDAAGIGMPYSATWAFTIGSPVDAVPVLNLFTTATPTLRWNALTYARQYQVQVSISPDFSSLVFTNTYPAGTLEARTNPLADGVYYWRVRAQDRTGTWGPWSTPSNLVVDA